MKKILLLMACAINLATVMQAENEPVYQWGKLTDGAGSDNPSEIKVNRDGDYFIFSTLHQMERNLSPQVLEMLQ